MISTTVAVLMLKAVSCDFYDLAVNAYDETVLGQKRIGIEMYEELSPEPDAVLGRFFYYNDDGTPAKKWTPITRVTPNSKGPDVSWLCPEKGKACEKAQLEIQGFEVSDRGNQNQILVQLPTDKTILEKNASAPWPKIATMSILGLVQNTDANVLQMGVCVPNHAKP